MHGTFENGNPYIEIEVGGVGKTTTIKALIDTGFNGYLLLPYIEAFPLGLVLHGMQKSTLADGSTSHNFVCVGKVCIDGVCASTTIDIHPSSAILLGTGLLKELGKKVTVDCVNESVEIIGAKKRQDN